MSVLGQRLRSERESRHLTLEQLARRLNMAKTSVYNHEKGASEPNTATLLQYAKTYGVSVSYLVGETDTRPLTGEGIDPDIMLHIQSISSRLTPAAKDDLIKCLKWIERDLL